MSNKISFSWDLHWACNYRCPYCWWHGRWDELAPRNRYPGTGNLVNIWKRIYEKYGEVHIEIAGG
jgi:organic radical activating enzyme